MLHASATRGITPLLKDTRLAESVLKTTRDHDHIQLALYSLSEKNIPTCVFMATALQKGRREHTHAGVFLRPVEDEGGSASRHSSNE